MEEREIAFFDYLLIIWNKKWIIILGTILCMITAGTVSFLIKPVYEIDAIIQPGKFYIQDQAGNLEQIIIEQPEQIADKVNHESYNILISQELEVNEKEIPKIRGEHIKNSLLTRFWLNSGNIELSKKILTSLIVLLKADIDNKIAIEINNIDTQISSSESIMKRNEIAIDSQKIEKEKIKKEISTSRNILKIVEKRKEEMVAEMKEVKKRIDSIEKEQIATLRKENMSESETLGLLLYTNEIQQSLQYINNLQELFWTKEIAEEDENLKIETNKEKLKQVDNQIDNLNNEIEYIKTEIENLRERKGRIDYTKIIKIPTSSRNPVWPNKKLNVFVAGFFGLMLLIVVAFFLDYIEKHRVKS